MLTYDWTKNGGQVTQAIRVRVQKERDVAIELPTGAGGVKASEGINHQYSDTLSTFAASFDFASAAAGRTITAPPCTANRVARRGTFRKICPRGFSLCLDSADSFRRQGCHNRGRFG